MKEKFHVTEQQYKDFLAKNPPGWIVNSHAHSPAKLEESIERGRAVRVLQKKGFTMLAIQKAFNRSSAMISGWAKTYCIFFDVLPVNSCHANEVGANPNQRTPLPKVKKASRRSRIPAPEEAMATLLGESTEEEPDELVAYVEEDYATEPAPTPLYFTEPALVAFLMLRGLMPASYEYNHNRVTFVFYSSDEVEAAIEEWESNTARVSPVGYSKCQKFVFHKIKLIMGGVQNVHFNDFNMPFECLDE